VLLVEPENGVCNHYGGAGAHKVCRGLGGDLVRGLGVGFGGGDGVGLSGLGSDFASARVDFGLFPGVFPDGAVVEEFGVGQ
jgi:hypothetical protein